MTLPCICCGKALEGVANDGNQPVHGTAFRTHGHYGSMFDPLPHSDRTLEVNVCNECLTTAGQAGRVHLVTYRPVLPPEAKREQWTAEMEAT